MLATEVAVTGAAQSADPISFWGSEEAVAGILDWLVKNSTKVAVRSFSEAEMAASSALREMLGILLMVECFGPAEWRGSTVRLRCDNRSCSFIFIRGSGIAALQAVTERIHDLLREYNIRLFVVWVPRLSNIMADHFSRLVDIGDQMLTMSTFQEISRRWGHVAVDLFATERTARCSKFISRFRTPGCMDTEAMTGTWETWAVGGTIYAFPPVFMAAEVTRRIFDFQVRVILVIPIWVGTGALQWLLKEDGAHFRAEVRGWRQLTRGTDIIRGSGDPDFLREPLRGRKDDFMALLIDTRVGRATGLVKTDFCYDRLMGRTDGCRCSQKGENR